MTKKLRAMFITLCIGILAICAFVIAEKVIDNGDSGEGVEVDKYLTQYSADKIASVKVQLANGDYYYVTEDAKESSGNTVAYKVTFNGIHEGLEFNATLAKQVVSYSAVLSAKRDMGEQTEDSLDVFGLSTPTSTVTITLMDGSETVLYMGNEASGGTGYFCMVKGDNHVYVVAQGRGDVLTTPVNGMRIDSIIPIQTLEEMEKMEWKFNDNPLVSFYRDLESSIFNPTVNFYVKDPWKQPIPVNGETIETMVTGIPTLEIVEHITPKVDGTEAVLSDYGLDNPWGWYRITGQDGSVLEIAYGDFVDEESQYECYMLDKISGHIYVVNYEKANYLSGYNHLNITSPYVVLANMNDISSVVAEYDGMKAVFEHKRESIGTDDEGNLKYSSTYTLDGIEYNKEALGLLYRNAIGMRCQNQYKDYEYDKNPLMVMTFTPFDTDVDPLVVKFYKINNDVCAVEINGIIDMIASISDVQDYKNAVQIVKDGGNPPYKF